MAMHSVVKSAAAAAVLLGERQAEQAELAHGQHGVDREGVVAVPRLGVRRDLALGEVADDLAERLLLVAELEVHRADRRRPYAGGRVDRRPARRRRRPAAAPTWSTSPPTSPPSTARASGPSCCPFDGDAGVRPLRHACGRPAPWPGRPWAGPAPRRVDARASTATAFCAGRATPSARPIAAGDVYQVNLTRRLSRAAARRTPTSPPSAPRWPTATRRPFTAVVRAARPRRARRLGVARALPVAATATGCGRRRSRAPPPTADGFLAKDRAENVMIVDLVRNDLGRVCECGSVDGAGAAARSSTTPASSTWCQTVEGRLRAGRRLGRAARRHLPARARSPARRSWPPSTHIAALEPVARGRLLRRRRLGRRRPPARATSTSPSARSGSPTGELHFGTGGGITWDSTPDGEWEETELKARRLLRVAVGAPWRPACR